MRTLSFLLLAGLATPLSALAAFKCAASIKYCPANPTYNIESQLASSNAVASAADCFTTVEQVRKTCSFMAPVTAFYSNNGHIEQISVITSNIPAPPNVCASGAKATCVDPVGGCSGTKTCNDYGTGYSSCGNYTGSSGSYHPLNIYDGRSSVSNVICSTYAVCQPNDERSCATNKIQICNPSGTGWGICKSIM